MTRRVAVLAAMLAGGCAPEPEPPPEPEQLEALALRVAEAVRPGFTLRAERDSALAAGLRGLGVFGAEVAPGSTAVVLRMAGDLRQVVYVYPLRSELPERGWYAELIPVGGPWLWFPCGPYGQRWSIYPC